MLFTDIYCALPESVTGYVCLKCNIELEYKCIMDWMERGDYYMIPLCEEEYLEAVQGLI